ncbi:MAG: hypothetical protein HOM11_08780 [Methylococcales bacterium]|jgi:hypothetical protein|nr:hypothetical protein [Methylococcales bacterium]MBT7445959.1 hypothetical protein [Methylococcales bacterium]
MFKKTLLALILLILATYPYVMGKISHGFFIELAKNFSTKHTQFDIAHYQTGWLTSEFDLIITDLKDQSIVRSRQTVTHDLSTITGIHTGNMAWASVNSQIVEGMSRWHEQHGSLPAFKLSMTTQHDIQIQVQFPKLQSEDVSFSQITFQALMNETESFHTLSLSIDSIKSPSFSATQIQHQLQFSNNVLKSQFSSQQLNLENTHFSQLQLTSQLQPIQSGVFQPLLIDALQGTTSLPLWRYLSDQEMTFQSDMQLHKKADKLNIRLTATQTDELKKPWQDKLTANMDLSSGSRLLTQITALILKQKYQHLPYPIQQDALEAIAARQLQGFKDLGLLQRVGNDFKTRIEYQKDRFDILGKQFASLLQLTAH